MELSYQQPEIWNDFFQFRLNIDISAVILLSIFWHNFCWPYVIRGAPNPKSESGTSYLHPKLYNTVEFQPPTRGRRPARAGPAFSGFPVRFHRAGSEPEVEILTRFPSVCQPPTLGWANHRAHQ